MYGITNYEKLFSGEFTKWLLEAGLVEFQCQMSIHYKYAPDEKKLLSYPIFMIVYFIYI